MTTSHCEAVKALMDFKYRMKDDPSIGDEIDGLLSQARKGVRAQQTVKKTASRRRSLDVS